ncbi:hypothetical protein Q8A73_001321 [Channa argus]|nr:hypothetical protein Q8A73_001321 [Channa argus]
MEVAGWTLLAIMATVCSELVEEVGKKATELQGKKLETQLIETQGPHQMFLLDRHEPASNSIRRQLEHFRFYTSAIFIASLALHAQSSVYPLERESLREARRKRQITISDVEKRKQDVVPSWLLIELADGIALSQCLPLRLSKNNYRSTVGGRIAAGAAF